MPASAIVERYIVPRYEGWEDILEPVIRKITGAAEGKVRAGCNYDNDTFQLNTHFIGSCSCSYSIKRQEFEENNKHTEDCFHTQWKELDKAFKDHPKYNQALILKTERINSEMNLCRKFRIPYHGGSYIEHKCTCGLESNWKSLSINHEDDCSVIQPNLWIKEDDVKFWWNKKFFRDSYSNKRITKEEFKKIIGKCMRSI